jgi:hypothetical protein
MTIQANATFGIKSWDEKPWHEGDHGRKLTRATVVKTYSGDLNGEGTMEYVMNYSNEKAAIFVGLERVTGHLDGRHGTFVMKDDGVFENGVAASSFEIVEGSGTGELAGIRGRASVDAIKADTQTITVDYTLD